MSEFGTAHIKSGKYILRGDFSELTANTPIRNEDDAWKLVGITNPRSVTHIHSYGGEAVFFERLGQAKLLGTRCDNPDCETQGSQYLPFRIYCPDCLARATVVDFTDLAKETAKIHTFMVCERSGAFNTLEKPIKFINVEFDGIATILMSYLVVGEPDIGDRVIPVFRTLNPTYTITDLAWVTIGAKREDLPEGFSFR